MIYGALRLAEIYEQYIITHFFSQILPERIFKIEFNENCKAISQLFHSMFQIAMIT